MRLTSELVMKLTDQVSSPAAKLAAATRKAVSDLGKVDGYRVQAKKLDEMVQAQQRARAKIRDLANEMSRADAPSKRMQRAYEAATSSADKLGRRIETQRAVVRGAGAALERMGVSVRNLAAGELTLRAAVDRTTASLQRQQAALARSAQRRQALGTMAGAAGVAIGYRARQFGRDALSVSGDFDTALRHQQFATDISAAEQKRTLVPQAERIGQDTKFTNEDVVRAQTEFANGLPVALKRADVLKPIIDQAKNYALTLKGVDMTQGAMAVRGYLLSLGKDISSPERADSEARAASNKMIRASKIGGLEHEDLMQLIQRGGSAARLIGLSEETILAMGVGMKRSNISGDQAGTALRTLSAKLANPTNKGLAAMATAGIDYSQYTKLPGGLSVENYEKKFRQDFGKSLTPAIRSQLAEAFEDGDVIGDQGAFAKAVTEAVAPLFGKKRDGSLPAADAKAIAKKAGEFQKFAIEAVEAERLLLDILAKDPSLGVLNALMTDKHGNKFGLLAKGFEQFMRDRQDLKNVAPDYGDKAAVLLQGGLGGALNQLTGAVETLKLRLASENESWLTPTVNSLAGTVDKLTELVKASPTTAAILGGAGAIGAGVGGAFKFVNDMLGGHGPAIALTASAAALTKSAFALDTAAVALGAGKAGSAVATATSAAATAGGSKLATAARFGIYGAGAFLTYEAIKAIGDGNEKRFEGVAPGEQHNWGRKRNAEIMAERRRRHQEFLEANTPKLPSMVGAPALDLSQVEQGEERARAAGEAIKDSLEVTARPTIDTSSVDALLAKVAQAKRELAGLDSQLAAASTRAGNIVRRRVDGIFADGN